MTEAVRLYRDNYPPAESAEKAEAPDVIVARRLIRENDTTQAIEVDHTKAGRVLNLLTVLSSDEVRLDEFKPHYDARFTNRFEPDGRGTRLTVIADVQLKGILRLFALIARPFVRRRLAKFVLRPIKAMAEADTSNGYPAASASRVPSSKN